MFTNPVCIKFILISPEELKLPNYVLMEMSRDAL